MSRTYGKAQDLIDFTRASSGTALRRVKYGAELVTNGTFDTDLSGWNTGSNVTSVHSSGTAQLTFGGAITSTFNNWFSQDVLSIGKVYIVTFDATNVSGGYLQAGYGYNVGITATTSGTYSFTVNSDYGNAIGKTNITFGGLTGAVWKIDNISVKEVTFDTSDGDLVLFNHPNNIPRIEYDANGNVLGLLVEESRTNTITSSNDATVLDTLGGASTVATNSTEVQSPTGSGTVIKLNKTGSTYGFARILFSGASTSVVFSVYAKKGTARYVGLRTLGSPNSTHTAFDFDTETFTQTTGSAARGYEKLPNGWYRLWIYNAAATNSAEWASAAIVDANGTESNTETGTLYLFGYQREINATFPTSYIPTSGSTATRSADVASIDVDAFGSNQDSGTILLECTTPQSAGGSFGVFYGRDSTSYVAGPYISGTGGLTTQAYYRDGASSEIAIANGSYSDSNKYGITYKLGKHLIVGLNGSEPVTESATVPQSYASVWTKFVIGSSTGGVGGYVTLHVKSLKYYPRSLTAEQLQELTS